MKLSTLFKVVKPKTLIFSRQTADPNGINFVSSKGTDNGVVERVKENSDNTLYKKGSITVPFKGSVLSAFVQIDDFYIAHQIAILLPLKPMTLSEKLFYCLCLRHNAFKYNYGRQADRTLSELQLPNKLPKYVTDKKIQDVQESIIDILGKISKKKTKKKVSKKKATKKKKVSKK